MSYDNPCRSDNAYYQLKDCLKLAYLTKVFTETTIKVSMSKKRYHLFHTSRIGKIKDQISVALST